MAEIRWRAADPATIISVPLDGLSALYHRSSGQTHVVAEPVPEILAGLGDGARTATELLALLADGQEVEGDGLALEARLAELAETGLVVSI